MESRGSNLGLPVSRLAVQAHRRCFLRPGRGASKENSLSKVSIAVTLAPGRLAATMNSYLFTAWVTRAEAATNRSRRGDYKSLATFDACSMMIIRAQSQEAARDQFEKGLLSHPGPDQE